MNLKHFSLLLLLVCSVHLHAEDSRARVFAFDLRTEIIDQVFYATFKCNTAFTEGKLHLYLPTVEHITEAHTPALTVPFTPATVDVDGALVRVPIPENQMTGDLATMLEVLNWAVELKGTPIVETLELVEYTDPTDENITFYLPQGIAINNNPYSIYFANMYIAQAADGRATDDDDPTDDWFNAGKYARTKTQKKGIYIYNPIFEELSPKNEGYLPSNIAMDPGWRHDLHRIAVNPANDNVGFAYRRSDGKSSSIYEIRPHDMCAKNKSNVNAIDVALGGPLTRTHSLCYDNDGALYVMDNTNVAFTPYTYATGKLYKQSDSEWELFVDGTTKGNLDINNKIVGLWPTMDHALALDGHDGVWVAQYRLNFLKDTLLINSKGEVVPELDLYPILTHITSAGEVDFMVTQRSAEDTIRMFSNDGNIIHESGRGASSRGQLAYFEKENLLAFAGNKRVTLYRVTYDPNGKPTLSKWLATPEIAADIDGVAFDYVGNLYVLSHTTQRLYAFALPTKEENRSFVPAPRKVITIDEKKDNANSDAMKFYQSMPANSVVDVKMLRPFTNQYWQTLTLPFAMGEEQTQDVFGDGTDVAVMGYSYLKSSDWLYVRFDFIDSVQRAVPCLVLPTQVLTRGAVVHEQVLSLDVQKVFTNYAQMHGVLAPMDFNAFRELHPDDNFYFLAPNQLLSDNAADTMLALRAYFKFALSKEQLQNLRAKVVFEEEVSTDIESVVDEDSSCLPTKVLRNGQLIICRDGAEFTLQGERLR